VSQPFLTAEWRYLAMLNFRIDPAVLQPLVPAGTELDFHKGETFVSVVGFLFLNTRVCGVPIPFHRNFEEVNLRFYVRRRVQDEWRRGVTFVRELVPRQAIALVARTFYNEPYLALPMRHRIVHEQRVHEQRELSVEYAWSRNRRWERLAMTAAGEPQAITPGSLEEFITEHYWGYTACGGECSEYGVEHPPWRVWNAPAWKLDADVARLYGVGFVPALTAPPISAFIAEGSPITVRRCSRGR